MKYKTYIFDFDFTLADASIGIIKSVNYALNQLGLNSAGCDDIRKTIGKTLEDILFDLTGISDNSVAGLFISHYGSMANKVMTANTALLDDTVKTLSLLKQSGRNTAIVTTKYRYRVNEALVKYNISELIDYIVGFEDVEIAKPSPEGLLKAIEHFGNDEQSVLYIGDSLVDANTAANASVDFAAVTTGTTASQDFLKLPHIYIAKNLTELMENVF